VLPLGFKFDVDAVLLDAMAHRRNARCVRRAYLDYDLATDDALGRLRAERSVNRAATR
jgi:hypothetical protein